MAANVDVVPDRMLNTADLMDIFRISERTLRKWLACGKLPTAVRIGRRLLWNPGPIRELLEGRHDDDRKTA